jgi:hypothetical protein
MFNQRIDFVSPIRYQCGLITSGKVPCHRIAGNSGKALDSTLFWGRKSRASGAGIAKSGLQPNKVHVLEEKQPLGAQQRKKLPEMRSISPPFGTTNPEKRGISPSFAVFSP